MISVFKKRKRGNAIIDTMLFIVLLFILATTWVIIGKIFTELNTEIQAQDISAEGKAFSDKIATDYNKIFDSAIIFFLILFWALIIVASFMIETHPVFFVFSFILLILMFTVVVVLGNTFDEIFTQDITGERVSFPFTFWIMDNLLVISVVIGFSVLFAMFARPK